jgi:dinuclear metal center YbgI/SA1388 family protein
MVTTGDLISFLETLAPLELAASWDNVGLLLDRRDVQVERVMTCLTVTPETADEAIQGDAHLIVSHHPILFRAVKRLTNAAPQESIVLDLARQGIAVYSPHTAFDDALGGINDLLARAIKLEDVGPLRKRSAAAQCKIVVFVPPSDLPRVSDALFAAGAGEIGQYSQCSFRLQGTGTFFGSESSNPTIGQKGRPEEVAEWRLEVVCPTDRLAEALARMRQAHSYEEPAFDVYPLQGMPAALSGSGRIGSLSTRVRLNDFAAGLKASLHATLVQVVGDSSAWIERVAIVCGSGGELIGDAISARADAFLTGELRFHDCLTAQAQGLSLVLPGHYATERIGVEELAGQLQARFPEVSVWASRREQDPLRSP